MPLDLDIEKQRPAGANVAVELGKGVDLPLVWCPPGRFVMGTIGADGTDEQPHPVVLSRGFWMARVPVTQEMWRIVMRSDFRFREGSDSERLPVEAMSFETAMVFCEKLEELLATSGRVDPPLRATLPTEAQWEYACRAGTTNRWYFGDDVAQLGEHAWFRENSRDETHPVGSKQPNPWGLFDLYGNVMEWCRDDLKLYGPDEVVDPCYVENGRLKVVRGGGYTASALQCRSARRESLLHDNPYSEETGIRVVLVARE